MQHAGLKLTLKGRYHARQVQVLVVDDMQLFNKWL